MLHYISHSVFLTFLQQELSLLCVTKQKVWLEPVAITNF